MKDKELMALARKAGLHESLTVFAALVAAAEREACAQLCEDLFSSDGAWCAEQIRAKAQSEVAL